MPARKPSRAPQSVGVKHKHPTYRDDDLRAVAKAAKRLASSAATLRQAVEPWEVRQWATTTWFALWQLAFDMSPSRWHVNFWKHRDFPALLRPEWPELGDLLTRIRWAAEWIALSVGVRQLGDYRPSKLQDVGDVELWRLTAPIRGDQSAESIRDLRDAAGELAERLKQLPPTPTGNILLPDFPEGTAPRPEASSTSEDDKAIVRMREAISSHPNGKTAKAATLIGNARIREKDGRRALRWLADHGEYDGFRELNGQ